MCALSGQLWVTRRRADLSHSCLCSYIRRGFVVWNGALSSGSAYVERAPCLLLPLATCLPDTASSWQANAQKERGWRI